MLLTDNVLTFQDSNVFVTKTATEGLEFSLIEKSIKGDLDSFNQLVLNYQDMAYHHAYAILGDHAQADDVTQDAFINAYLKIHQFRGGSFRAWLLRIVTNQAYDLLRRSKHTINFSYFAGDDEIEEMDSAPWLVDTSPSVEATIEQRELRSHIQRALDEMPEIYRSVINLIDVYELDYQEAAVTLKVPIGTLKSRLARGRQMMQGKFNRLNTGKSIRKTIIPV